MFSIPQGTQTLWKQSLSAPWARRGWAQTHTFRGNTELEVTISLPKSLLRLHRGALGKQGRAETQPQCSPRQRWSRGQLPSAPAAPCRAEASPASPTWALAGQTAPLTPPLQRCHLNRREAVLLAAGKHERKHANYMTKKTSDTAKACNRLHTVIRYKKGLKKNPLKTNTEKCSHIITGLWPIYKPELVHFNGSIFRELWICRLLCRVQQTTSLYPQFYKEILFITSRLIKIKAFGPYLLHYSILFYYHIIPIYKINTNKRVIYHYYVWLIPEI